MSIEVNNDKLCDKCLNDRWFITMSMLAGGSRTGASNTTSNDGVAYVAVVRRRVKEAHS
jgi:hypothetical protein